MSLCLSVCLSQVGVLSKLMHGSSWVLAQSSACPRLCSNKIQESTKYRYCPVQLCPQLTTRKLSPRSVDHRSVLSTQLKKGGRSERHKLDRRRSAELTIPPSSDARPLAYHTDRQALSTAHCVARSVGVYRMYSWCQ